MVSKASFGAVCAVSSLLLFSACSSSGGGDLSFAILTDTDDDGLPDSLETALGSDPMNPDDPTPSGNLDVDNTFGPGEDALSDALEQYLANLGANQPVTARTDSDLDGIPDYLEVASGLDHLDFNIPIVDGAADSDESSSSGPPGDGITDALEAYLAGRGASFPVTSASDSDADGFADLLETQVGTDPFESTSPRFYDVFDVDRDGLPDHFELSIGSDPLNSDFPVFRGAEDSDGGLLGPDGDALTDGVETYLQREGVPTPVTTLSDSDSDGVPDYVEIMADTGFFDPNDPVQNGGSDSNNATGPADSISDALEMTLIRGGAIAPVSEATDSDGDGIADFAELLSGSNAFSSTSPSLFDHFDLDADGVPDFLELVRLNDPQDADDPLANGGADENNQLGPGGDRISDAMELVVAQIVGGGAVTTFDDTDSDGISDYVEALIASDPLDLNSPVANGDQDVTPETGPGGDGISDAVEALLISLGSSAPVGDSNNSDADIIPDFIELLIGSNPLDGFDPAPNQVSDIDGDEAPDYFELLFASDPLSPDIPLVDGANDDDRDGLSNALEELLRIAIGRPPGFDSMPLDDFDGDGLFDYLEAFAAVDILDPTSPAATGGFKDNDTNDVTGPGGDGISDALELYLSLGGATHPVTSASDTDGDFLADILEVTVVTDPFDATSPFADPNADNDGDGVPDSLEFVIQFLGVKGEIDAGTDTDSDGAPDYLEVLAAVDLLSGDDPVVDGANDLDDDGLSEALEAVLVQLVGGDFNSQSDSDFDGIPDYYEVQTASNPLLEDHPLLGGAGDANDDTGLPDTISDAFEMVLIQQGAMGPISQGTDTDFDGTADYLEVLAATDAFDDLSPVENGRGDPDRDRLRNSTEIVLVRLGADDPAGLLSDTDGDGAPDYVELLIFHNPINSNNPVLFGGDGNDVNEETGPNGDGISDALELILIRQGAKAPVGTPTDTDADGIPDYFEVTIGSNPFITDAPFPNGDEDTDNDTGPTGDGISDALEAVILFFADQVDVPLEEVTTLTDIDLDGVPDYIEVYLGTNLIDSEDFPDDGLAPEARGLALQGEALEGATLTGSYVYFDEDADFEGVPIFRWLREGVAIDGADAPTYVISADDLGKTLSFEVTPVSLYAWPLSSLVGDPATVSIGIPAPGIALTVGGPGGVGRVDGLSDLTLWLQADHGIRVDEDADDERVVGWSDKSSLGVQVKPGLVPPTFIAPSPGTSGTPGTPAAVRFDGRNGLTLPRTIAGEFTLVATFRTDELESWLVGSAPKTGEFADLLFGLSDGRPALTVVGRSLNSDARADDNQLHTLRAVVSSDTISLTLDGTLLSTLQRSAFGELTPARLTIGSATEGLGMFAGDISELVLFDRALNGLEQRLVDHYLTGRYGTRLEDTLYGAFETHPVDIAGIGRDGDLVQNEAHGTGEVILSNPTSLDSGDFLFIGASVASQLFSEDVPNGVAARLARSWAYTETSASTQGIGRVDVTFLLGADSLARTSDDLVLLMDDDGDFSDATLVDIEARYDAFRATAVFEGVELSGEGYFALGLFPSSH